MRFETLAYLVVLHAPAPLQAATHTSPPSLPSASPPLLPPSPAVRAVALVNLLAAREWIEGNLYSLEPCEGVGPRNPRPPPPPEAARSAITGRKSQAAAAVAAQSSAEHLAGSPLCTDAYCWSCGAGQPFYVPDRAEPIDCGRVVRCEGCWKVFHPACAAEAAEGGGGLAPGSVPSSASSTPSASSSAAAATAAAAAAEAPLSSSSSSALSDSPSLGWFCHECAGDAATASGRRSSRLSTSLPPPDTLVALHPLPVMLVPPQDTSPLGEFHAHLETSS